MPKRSYGQDDCLPPQVLQINNRECPTLFHKVTIPVEIGDDESYPPKPGLYRNTLLVYEANHHVWMYSSDGIPTFISDGSQVIDDYNELTNKPSIEGHELIGNSTLYDIGVIDAITTALVDYTKTDDLATVALSGDYDDLLNKPTIPTKTSDLTNDSDFVSDANYVHTDNNFTDALESKLEGIAAGAEVNVQSDWDVTDSSSDAFIKNKPTIPTVNDATLTIKRNNESVGTFTANSATNTDINITVPVTAADVHALPDSTKYGASIVMSINTADYKVTTTLKDQDGNTLGTAQVIDLPLESVVVNGSYDSANKKIVLTLQNGNTIDIPVGDLISGLQTEITPTNMLSADLVDDTFTTHKFTTATDISKLAGIAAGAEVNVQSNWNEADSSSDAYIQNKPSIPTKTSDLTNDGADNTSTYVEADELATVATSGSYTDLTNTPTIPTVNNATLTIQKNSTNVATFTANASSDVTANISVPTKTSDLTNDGADGTSTYVEADDLATVATSGSYNDLSNKPTIPAAQVNSDWDANSGVAQILNKPNLATVATSGSYNDLTDKPTIDFELVEMSYGESNAWAKFIAAYQGHKIVYCRASSNSNPATGAQNRKAFMAYVNDATNPTEVEFQYVRSVSSKTSSQPVDQVFVYKLTSASGGTWTVQTRDMGPKLAQGTNTTVSYSNGTYTISATQPTVPTKTSDLINDGSDGASTYVESNELAEVATTGSYEDLSDKPTIPAAQVNADWDASSGVAQILNKPSLATVATSGSYNDLSDKPTIPTVNNATLTIQKNGTTVNTFTANASSNVTANITVPTATSDLTNDSGFITSITKITNAEIDAIMGVS